MTEAEWLECVDPGMLLIPRGQILDRQLILFACACCQRAWHLFPNESCRGAIAAAERFADGRCSEIELRRARKRIEAEQPNLHWPQDFGCHAELAAYYCAFDATTADEFEAEHPLGGKFDDMLAAVKDEAADLIAYAASGGQSEDDFPKERAAQCAILRDIIGNPFRRGAVDPAWLVLNNAAIPKLAQSIYDDRAFDRLPLLADALVAAGCTNEDILAHCRSGCMHVRGCWVVDLLLGKQ
jgi:hypothetical protein